MLKRILQLSMVIIFMSFLPWVSAVFGQTNISSSTSLIEKNIRAVGGDVKLAGIKNFSFKIVMKDYREVVTEFNTDSTGRMKIIVGKKPW